MFEKVTVFLYCSTLSSEELFAVDNDNVYVSSIMTDKDILEFVHTSKNIIDADSNDENEMNKAAHVPMPSETKNIMKSRRTFKW
ncbi:hypothetical protein TNCV_1430001 [Trichonephila clavipes]|nr:hypothetical protein TNCV_1430001 [Trichonephila clavipes]